MEFTDGELILVMDSDSGTDSIRIQHNDFEAKDFPTKSNDTNLFCLIFLERVMLPTYFV